MRRLLLRCVALCLGLVCAERPILGQERFPDARDEPISGWKGPVFRLSQDYPELPPPPETFPWVQFDPSTQSSSYVRALLEYALEGNEADDWSGSGNPVRKWYHAPWLHWGRNGREFIHGLTHERVAQPGELAPTHVRPVQNWAVGLYSAQGGYTIGQVWRDRSNPDPTAAVFLEGTVTIKFLFTEANEADAPFLRGAKEWDAYIYDNVALPTNANGPRSVRKLRLLQVDVAVKDKRNVSTGGWAFGTFVYNGFLPGVRLWDRFVAVGLMWGNDPDVTVAAVRKGVTLKETWINPDRGVPFQHLGWAGRLNGPVDNPVSSCLSCHATAQWPARQGMVPPRTVDYDSPEFMRWFRNIKSPTETFSPGTTSLDYSLQLLAGLSSFQEWKRIVQSKGGNTLTDKVNLMTEGARLEQDLAPLVTRSGRSD